MKLILTTIAFVVISIASIEINAQTLTDSDVCFYTAMFRDETSASPFAVAEVKFANSNRSNLVIVRNGFLVATFREAGLDFKEGYVKTMLELKRRAEPLVLPEELKQKLEPYLLQPDDSCAVVFSLQGLEKRDRYVKFLLKVKRPLDIEKEKCLVFELFKKRELVMTFSESGAYFLPYIECD
ncbi:hypothetical protein SAMN04488109_2593 [Chryseolinea serpens]|uniref:Uncharacterized protein n=1 Tax=Chryseolinea serpens TaxID=947013 RepID=A0A1M5NZC3_9BACT|nr:hypothetical protein [Chryseolinea serpens]SHG94805.1 hypothetical protein SAMN04488109_2593 [Chryseolinea serpens]